MSILHRVGVYGIGSFGYAMLRHLEHKAEGQISLRAFDRNDEVRRALAEQRHHPYHDAGTPLAKAVTIVDSVPQLIDGLDVLVLAVTSDSTREVMQNVGSQSWSGP